MPSVPEGDTINSFLRFIAAPYSLFSESAPIFKSSNKQKYGWEQERIPLKRFGVDQIE